jgi:hypothetical protein
MCSPGGFRAAARGAAPPRARARARAHTHTHTLTHSLTLTHTHTLLWGETVSLWNWASDERVIHPLDDT